MQLVQHRGPLIATIFDLTITKYGHDHIHGFIGFHELQKLGKNTTIISLAYFLDELWMIL